MKEGLARLVGLVGPCVNAGNWAVAEVAWVMTMALMMTTMMTKKQKVQMKLHTG